MKDDYFKDLPLKRDLGCWRRLLCRLHGNGWLFYNYITKRNLNCSEIISLFFLVVCFFVAIDKRSFNGFLK